METKLTLKLNNSVIKKAKLYSKRRNISLSKIVENYFKLITEDNSANRNTKLINELSGIISIDDLDKVKSGYPDYLLEKYK